MALPLHGGSTSQHEEVVRLLADAPDGLSDGELTRALTSSFTGIRPQTVNQLCRRMVAAGTLERIGSRPIRNRLVAVPSTVDAPAVAEPEPAVVPPDPSGATRPEPDVVEPDAAEPDGGPDAAEPDAGPDAAEPDAGPDAAEPGGGPDGAEDGPALATPGDGADLRPDEDDAGSTPSGATDEPPPSTPRLEALRALASAARADDAEDAPTGHPPPDGHSTDVVDRLDLPRKRSSPNRTPSTPGHRTDNDPRDAADHFDFPRRKSSPNRTPNTPGRRTDNRSAQRGHEVSLPRWDVLQGWSRTVNVTAALADWLRRQGATIRAASGGAGPAQDLVARLDGDDLHVEVTGWPPDGARTHPTTLAADWFTAATRAAEMRRRAHPRARVVIALPDTRRYRSLTEDRADALAGVRTEVWFVGPGGAVHPN